MKKCKYLFFENFPHEIYFRKKQTYAGSTQLCESCSKPPLVGLVDEWKGGKFMFSKKRLMSIFCPKCVMHGRDFVFRKVTHFTPTQLTRTSITCVWPTLATCCSTLATCCSPVVCGFGHSRNRIPAPGWRIVPGWKRNQNERDGSGIE